MQLTSLSLALTRAGFLTFSPSALFAAGEQGAWYDPSDVNVTWRRNLLTYTEQFDNAAWTKLYASVTANTVDGPFGGQTADTVSTDGTANGQRVGQNPSNATGDLTFSIYARAGTNGFIQLAHNSSVNMFANFDLGTGAVGTKGTAATSSIQSIGNGWYRCSVTFTVATSNDFRLFIVSSASATYAQAFPAAVATVHIWGAQLELGSTASAYQRIVTPEITYLQDVQPQPVLFQDSAGTTPVTAIEQPVGLMLDKSKGAAWVSLGTTGWVKTSGDGAVTVVGNTITITGATTTTIVAPAVTRTIRNGQTRITALYTNTGSATGPLVWVAGVPSAPTSGVALTNTQNSTNSSVDRVQISSGSAEFVIQAYEERQGNHAFQSTAASRPVLSGRYNLLTKTEDFSDATAWNVVDFNSSISANANTAPDGTNTADKLVENTANAIHLIRSAQATFSFASGVAYTQTWHVKAAGRTKVSFAFADPSFPGTARFATFDLTAQTAVANGGSGTASIVALSNGWYRCSYTQTADATAATNYSVLLQLLDDSGNSAYTGDGTSGVFIWGADLRVANDGVGIPAYQRVNTSTDYDTTGFPLYLRCDGVDDGMQTNSINFTATDKMTVVAGVRKLSDAARGVFAELGNGGINTNQWVLNAPTAALGDFGWSSVGTAAANAISSAAAPATRVASGLGDISGDSAIIRINGAQAASSASDQGTGNYGNYPLFIGRRGGTTLPFNGRIYSIIVRGAQSTPAQIAALEQWVNSKTRAY